MVRLVDPPDADHGAVWNILHWAGWVPLLIALVTAGAGYMGVLVGGRLQRESDLRKEAAARQAERKRTKRASRDLLRSKARTLAVDMVDMERSAKLLLHHLSRGGLTHNESILDSVDRWPVTTWDELRGDLAAVLDAELLGKCSVVFAQAREFRQYLTVMVEAREGRIDDAGAAFLRTLTHTLAMTSSELCEVAGLGFFRERYMAAIDAAISDRITLDMNHAQRSTQAETS